MRILALYPAFDPRINEMAMLWERLCATHDVACTVLAGTRDVLKAHEAADNDESRGQLHICRFARLTPTAGLLDRGCAFRPDLIFCAVTENMRLAGILSRKTGAPVILHNEYFLDNRTFLRRRYHTGIPPLRAFVGWIGRTYIHRSCASILISNPVERRLPGWRKYSKLRYLPWPHPDVGAPAARDGRDMQFSAYIGSMSRGKGARQLLRAYAALLQAMPAFRLQIVGPAVDAEGKHTLRVLRERFPKQVTTLQHCSRQEAMALLRKSLFVFSPARRYGWGLIGDAWGTGTPVISVVEHYDLSDGVNCLVAKDAATFVRHATALRDDAALFNRITAGGQATVAGHSLDAVAAVLWKELGATVREE